MMKRIRESSERSRLTGKTSEGILIHEKAEDMPSLKGVRFVHLEGGAVLTVEDGQLHRSDDQGRSWMPLPAHSRDGEIPGGTLIRTARGTLILAYANKNERLWTWDDALKDAPGARLPTYVMRSLDSGRTWQDIQKLHDEWTGAIRDILQTSDGRVVFTSMKMLHNPGRHGVLTYSSEDEGRSWCASNLIDLGGNGHHGGVTEGTIVELKDGRLLQYIRTNWSQFWLAFSSDCGRSWHPYGPSGVDASSAPGILKRLRSGRIALLWNRLYPEGQDSYPLRGGDCLWSATPVSNHREELSISFSEDECESWSPPVVIARNPDGGVSYPHLFEHRPGLLWVTAGYSGLRIRLREEDFLR